MLLWKFLRISVRSQMQYKSSFVILLISHFITTFAEIFAIWILFDRFKVVKGWTLEELCLIYGIVHMGFAAAEAFARGFDTFDQMIKKGEFDRLLVRPMSTLWQVAAAEVQLMRFGRFFQGFFILLYGMNALQLSWYSWHAGVLFLAFLGTFALFYGLFVIQATISFWTVEALAIMDLVTYGGVSTGQYPMSIYKRAFRLIFTFVVPLATVGYYPIAALLHKEELPFSVGLVLPLSGLLFFLAACQFWRIGVYHYRSSGG